MARDELVTEIYALSAQTLAFEASITKVFYQLSKADPRFAAAIRQGFDDAASFVENFAIEKGKAASPEHTVKALRIVEELREPHRSATMTSRATSFRSLGFT